MAKKSLFERMGLVESQEEQSIEDVQAELRSFSGSETQDLEQVPEDMLLDGVIDIPEIYEKFELNGSNVSIYKVEEFSSVLPKELNNEAKKLTVIGILGTSNLQVEDLLDDGEKRKSALMSTLDAFTNETNTIVETKKAEIEELEAKIDALKTEINDRKKMQEQEEEIIATEKEKLDAIINFIQ